MDNTEPDNRPVIAETNGVTAGFNSPGAGGFKNVPVIGWTSDGAALVAHFQGVLVRAAEQPDFWGLTGRPIIGKEWTSAG